MAGGETPDLTFRTNGAITNLEFLTDRVRIHYPCATPWESPTRLRPWYVTYESIKALPSPPGLDHGFQVAGGPGQRLCSSRQNGRRSVFLLHNGMRPMIFRCRHS